MRLSAVALVLSVLFGLAVPAIPAGELDPGSLRPAIPAAEAEDFQTEEDEDGEDGDAPLEPALEGSVRRGGLRYGAVLEYWLADPAGTITRLPSDISLTGMVDDLRQPFAAAAMLRDPELKRYATRPGLLRWTTYYRVTRPGKHVFAVAGSGFPAGGVDVAGVALAVNDEAKIRIPDNRDGSAVVDFPAPGWYKLGVWIWDTRDTVNFQDYTVSLKVREPGSLSLRPLGRKDLYYRLP